MKNGYNRTIPDAKSYALKLVKNQYCLYKRISNGRIWTALEEILAYRRIYAKTYCLQSKLLFYIIVENIVLILNKKVYLPSYCRLHLYKKAMDLI
jgi:hypothetical protein